jgi:acyl carrier protein
MSSTDDRKARIKQLVVERLNLAIDPTEIGDDTSLFSPTADGGLGLDSVDALELAVALNAEFDVEIGDDDMGIFESVGRMAAFVDEKLQLT